MNLVLKYFHDLSNDQLNKFTQLSDIYPRLNSKINLVSRKDIEFLCLKQNLDYAQRYICYHTYLNFFLEKYL